MIAAFKNLTSKEQEDLLKVPVLVSLYASSSDHDISRSEKADAIKFAHFKTFTSEPMLIAYYKEVDLKFKSLFEEQVLRYWPFDDEKRKQLNQEIGDLLLVADKLDASFAAALLSSLSDYAKNIKRASRGNMINFVFPLPLPGLTD